MLPHSELWQQKQLFLITAAQRAFLSARLASAVTLPWTLMRSPWAPHQKIQIDPNLLYCFPIALIAIWTALRHTQGGPRTLKGPLRLTCALYRAVDSPTALSVVRLVLSDTKPTLDIFIGCIDRMTLSTHVS